MEPKAPKSGQNDARASRRDPLWVDDADLQLPELDAAEVSDILRRGRISRRSRLLGTAADGTLLRVHPDDMETLAWWGAAFTLQVRHNLPAHQQRMRRLRVLKADAEALGEEFYAPELLWDEGATSDGLLRRTMLRHLLEEFQEVWHRHGGEGVGLSNSKAGEFGGVVVELAEYVLGKAGLTAGELPSRSAMHDAWKQRGSSAGKPKPVKRARYAGDPRGGTDPE